MEFERLSFDSYMIPEENLFEPERDGLFRNLECTVLCLPNNRNIRVLVTASDVLHS
jgi:heme/copper-type cytochrome/quinol oxidase subunit 2